MKSKSKHRWVRVSMVTKMSHLDDEESREDREKARGDATTIEGSEDELM